MRVLDHPAFQILLLSAVLLLMASPSLWPQQRDDFPFSAYAMFSTRQDERTAVTHAVAVFEGGREVPLAPRFFGTDEVLQAKVTLINTQKRGKRAQMELCWEVCKWQEKLNIKLLSKNAKLLTKFGVIFLRLNVGKSFVSMEKNYVLRKTN